MITWLLGEVFARTRRLFLPAIVILLGFAAFFAVASMAIYLYFFDFGHISSDEQIFQELQKLTVLWPASACVACLLFYLRTKLPIAMGLGAAGLAGAGAAAVAPASWSVDATLWLQLGQGVFLFLLGLFFDARDPERRTRLSDNAFWLHFFAAPAIFLPTLMLTTGRGIFDRDFSLTTGAAAVTLAIVFGFALISLLINRRALLVSGMLSAALSIGVLVNGAGLGGAWTAALTLLLLGGAMVLLGGGWHTVRRVLTAPFPKTGLIARIIPPEPPRGAAQEADAPAG